MTVDRLRSNEDFVGKSCPFIFVCFICSEILSIYGIGKRSVFDVISIVLSVIALLSVLKNQTYNKVIPFTITLLCLDEAIIEFLTVGRTFPAISILHWSAYLSVWYFITRANVCEYIRLYRSIGIVLVAYFYLQFLCNNVLGLNLPSNIPGLPVCDNFGGDWIIESSTSERVSSLFSEPSYLCRFILPLATIELFREKVSLPFLLYLASPLVLTFSGTGIIAFGSMLFYWYLTRLHFRSKKSIIKMVALSLFLCLCIYFVNGTTYGERIIDRSSELSRDYEEGSGKSGYIRIWLGFDIYNDYSISEKIFGNMNDDAHKNHLSNTLFGSIVNEKNLGYMGSGWSVLLQRQGIIGLVILLWFLIVVWKKASLTGRAILITFCTYMFTESVYPGCRFSLYIILAYCLDNTVVRRLNLH